MKNFIILTLLLLTSCVVTKKQRARICAECPVTVEKIDHKKDSSWVIETVKTVTVPISISGPTLYLPSPCDEFCDKEGRLKPFYRETTKNGIKQKLFTDTSKNQLIQECDVDKYISQLKEVTIEKNRLIQENIVLKQIKPVLCEKLHKDWLDKYDRPWFYISLGAFVFYIVKLLLKYKLKILTFLNLKK